MIDFTSPFLESPKALAPGNDWAPALAIYLDADGTISVSGTQLIVVVGGNTVTVNFVGKSLEEVAAEISVASASASCNALNVVQALEADELVDTGELTSDGGHVIRMKRHVVRYQEETRIRVLPPYPERRSKPWYPRVDRGQVKVRRQGVDFIFGVPEYAEQEWSTYFGAPFVDVLGEQATYVSARMVRVARTPVFWHRRNISVSIDQVPMGSSVVADVDVNNGFVKLTTDISPQKRVLINYTYRERSLVYKEVDLNPSMEHNPMVIDHVVLLYVLPAADSLGHTRTSTVRHVVAKTVVGAISAIPRSDEPVLVLGAYQVRPTAVITDLQVRDARSWGGGLRKDATEDAIRLDEEVRAFADIGRYDGIPFPGAAAGVLTIERGFLDSIPQDLAEQLIKKHVAGGGLVVLNPVETL